MLKKNLILIGSTLSVVIGLAIVFSFGMPTENPWKIPAKYKKMENPTDITDKEGLKSGKKLYRKHCASCHGKTGIGDGTKAGELETSCGDFTSDEFKAQKPGEQYFKSFIGRDEMPNFEKKIKDEEDRWLVINYINSL